MSIIKTMCRLEQKLTHLFHVKIFHVFAGKIRTATMGGGCSMKNNFTGVMAIFHKIIPLF